MIRSARPNRHGRPCGGHPRRAVCRWLVSDAMHERVRRHALIASSTWMAATRAAMTSWEVEAQCTRPRFTEPDSCGTRLVLGPAMTVGRIGAETQPDPIAR